jgi:dienelactone hydrolase
LERDTVKQCKLLALLLSLLFAVGVVSAQQAASVDLYARDANQPLNAEVKAAEDTADWTVYHVLYDSTNGQRVPALLAIPKTGGKPFPLIMVQHGLGGSKDVDYIRLPALALAKAGYATLRIDAHSHGERAPADGAQDTVARVLGMVQSGGWEQSIVDMRRGLDYCATRDDIDMERVGYMGVSMGAIMGGVLCGVDDRIDAAVLMLGGSLAPLGGFMPGLLDAIDPANYIANFAPHPLLMLNGKQDPLITPVAAQQLYDAAKDPKRIVWYDTTHTLPLDEAVKEVTAFLAEHVPVTKP